MGELIDKAKGAANEAVGKAKQQSGNPDTRDRGAAQEVKGKAQKAAGSVKGAFGNKV
ncbi:CsbD family protein [Sphingobium sp. DEHP117]|uniref:CsbD family protein n=1 Tax=Sphingobium sp. DEHP117 TaxID=2993436 RepID=UPI0027D716FF|nr:CsbD family protein [Sphingobium sp. DEHP117]MDQ4421811.1 CsbD family protein [Sphingobium sp. DEHP117]